MLLLSVYILAAIDQSNFSFVSKKSIQFSIQFHFICLPKFPAAVVSMGFLSVIDRYAASRRLQDNPYFKSFLLSCLNSHYCDELCSFQDKKVYRVKKIFPIMPQGSFKLHSIFWFINEIRRASPVLSLQEVPPLKEGPGPSDPHVSPLKNR